MLGFDSVLGVVWGFSIVALWFLFRRLQQLRDFVQNDWQRRSS
jgi:hypothetical protein